MRRFASGDRTTPITSSYVSGDHDTMMKNDRYTCAHRLLRRIRGFVLILTSEWTTLNFLIATDPVVDGVQRKGYSSLAPYHSVPAWGRKQNFCRFVVVIIVSYLPGEIDRHFTQEMSYPINDIPQIITLGLHKALLVSQED